MKKPPQLGLLALLAILLVPVRAAETPKILSRDHTVEVRSTVPAIAGQTVKLHVRERVSAAMIGRKLDLQEDRIQEEFRGRGADGNGIGPCSFSNA